MHPRLYTVLLVVQGSWLPMRALEGCMSGPPPPVGATGRFHPVCPYCRRSFTRQDSLKQHLRIHTGECPYKCIICGHAFKHRTSLLRHKSKCTTLATYNLLP
ncbi:uncharacterized protein LOC143031114 [Oratosquilla oratoria]|uniref:uncharacterized protein LOC143031114 n=1 Tax=Oratosquilla oratoria TaxID=337810 RepID=UPI003F777991